MKKRLLSFVVVAAMLITCLPAFTFAQDAEVKTPVGMSIAGFQTTDLNGNVVTDTALESYSYTLLNVWATWCQPCIVEMPDLQQIYEDYAPLGVNVMGLLVEDTVSTLAGAIAFLNENGISYTSLRIDSVLQSAIDACGTSIPVSMLVDDTGYVVDYVVGTLSYEGFCELIDTTLNASDPESITLNPSAAQINVGASVLLTPEILPANYRPMEITWVSSEPSVATVTSEGVVSGVSLGTTSITATLANGLSATASITVIEGIPDQIYVPIDLPNSGFDESATYAFVATYNGVTYAMTDSYANSTHTLQGFAIGREYTYMLGDQECLVNLPVSAQWSASVDATNSAYNIASLNSGNYLGVTMYSLSYRLALTEAPDYTWLFNYSGQIIPTSENLANYAVSFASPYFMSTPGFDLWSATSSSFAPITVYRLIDSSLVEHLEITAEIQSPGVELELTDPFYEVSTDPTNRYFMANDTEVTFHFTLPEAADPERSFLQCAYDWWTPVFFSELTFENGVYVYTTPIDSLETTGFDQSDIQVYINQNVDPFTQMPDYVYYVFADTANADSFVGAFDSVSWDYAEVEVVIDWRQYIAEPILPADEILINDPESLLDESETADRYFIANNEDITFQFVLPEAANPATSFVTYTYDGVDTVYYFSNLQLLGGVYYFTGDVDSSASTGNTFSKLTVKLNGAVGDPADKSYIIFSDYSNVNSFALENGVTWSYLASENDYLYSISIQTPGATISIDSDPNGDLAHIDAHYVALSTVANFELVMPTGANPSESYVRNETTGVVTYFSTLLVSTNHAYASFSLGTTDLVEFTVYISMYNGDTETYRYNVYRDENAVTTFMADYPNVEWSIVEPSVYSMQVVTPGAREVEILDPSGALFYNAANRYFIVNGTEVTLAFTLPNEVPVDRCYIQCAFNGWLPVYFETLDYIDGVYYYTTEIDSINTTGYASSDVQVYIDQDGNQFTHWPNYIYNFYADEENLDFWCSDFADVTWEYMDTPSPDLPGDANGDGVVNIGDASMILRYVVGIVGASDIRLDLCDLNEDGTVNTGDAAYLLGMLVTRW